MMTNKVDKLVSLRFTSPTDPILAEALAKLQSEKWDERTELLGMWYKCWLESQQRNYEGVAGEN